jgi:probable addiction module antidote protein
MSTVFIGGSRHIRRLSAHVKERLDNAVSNGCHIIVGDANGADKAVQKYLQDISYRNVTVFCSGENCRNNLGKWKTHHVKIADKLKGFEFYAVKDRQMAREADFGLMIWDGKSAGTILNVLRLVGAGKKAVLLNTPEKQITTFETKADWDIFISQRSFDFRNDLRKRATPEEWKGLQSPQQMSFLDEPELIAVASGHAGLSIQSDDELRAEINAALAAGDSASVVDALGNLARAHGMSQVAKDTGLSRESLYRSLSAGGNPEFTTVLKVISSVGLRLRVGKACNKGPNDRS